jgi:hypothetical protein
MRLFSSAAVGVIDECARIIITSIHIQTCLYIWFCYKRRRKMEKVNEKWVKLFAGSSAPVRYLSLRSLLPDTDYYMTYEGSTTHPGCWETAIWVVLNKPIYITKQEVRRTFIKQQSKSTPARDAPILNKLRKCIKHCIFLRLNVIATNSIFAFRSQSHRADFKKALANAISWFYSL